MEETKLPWSDPGNKTDFIQALNNHQTHETILVSQPISQQIEHHGDVENAARKG